MDRPKLNMRQHILLDVVKDYNYEIFYHPGKEDMVAGALSRRRLVLLLDTYALG